MMSSSWRRSATMRPNFCESKGCSFSTPKKPAQHTPLRHDLGQVSAKLALHRLTDCMVGYSAMS